MTRGGSRNFYRKIRQTIAEQQRSRLRQQNRDQEMLLDGLKHCFFSILHDRHVGFEGVKNLRMRDVCLTFVFF
jgi:hypothetical protein